MKTWFAEHWEDLRASFWFVPLLMLAGGIGLAFAMLNIDRVLGTDWFEEIGWVSLRGPEGARALLSAVANSMMTIASLTFSMTIVTLQLASSQFGPRLLRNFIRDLGNQMVLGTFIATFAYCLMVLRAVNGVEDHQFVPELAITIGIGLALLSLGVLIYFIHHIATLIQAGSVIANVGSELHSAIQRLYPHNIGEDEADVSAPENIPLKADFSLAPSLIIAPESNYLQSIDSDKLFSLAAEHQLILKILYRPGHFIIENATLVSAWPAKNMTDTIGDSIQEAFYFGSRRTSTQDLEFGIDQLVEVAVRALSPGINDPFTAASCIDRLGAVIAELSTKRFPSPLRYDKEGHLRVMAEISSPADIMDAAFHQIRQALHSNTATTLRLLDTFQHLLKHPLPFAFRESVLRHAELVYLGSQDGLVQSYDRDKAKRHYERLGLE